MARHPRPAWAPIELPLGPTDLALLAEHGTLTEWTADRTPAAVPSLFDSPAE